MKHSLLSFLLIITASILSLQASAASFIGDLEVYTYQTESTNLIAYATMDTNENTNDSVTVEAVLRANTVSDKLTTSIYLQKLNNGQWSYYECIVINPETNLLLSSTEGTSTQLSEGNYRVYTVFTCNDDGESETVTAYSEIITIN